MLERNTNDAVDTGDFDARIYVVEGELFAGPDRLDALEARLAEQGSGAGLDRFPPPIPS
jgi:2-hydroxychromene-2-carboxylate isomerase